MLLLTAFDHAAWNSYGRRFYSSYKLFSAEVPLKVAFYNWPEEEPLPAIDEAVDLRNSKWLYAHPEKNHESYRWWPKIATLIELRDESQWTIWLDGDTQFYRKADFSFLNNAADVALLGRRDAHCNEGSFYAFNGTEAASLVLRSWADVYLKGEFRFYNPSTDNAILDRVLQTYATNSIVLVQNLSENAIGLDAWHQSMLGTFMLHFKGPNKEELSNPTFGIKEEQLFFVQQLLETLKPRNVTFIGEVPPQVPILFAMAASIVSLKIHSANNLVMEGRINSWQQKNRGTIELIKGPYLNEETDLLISYGAHLPNDPRCKVGVVYTQDITPYASVNMQVNWTKNKPADPNAPKNDDPNETGVEKIGIFYRGEAPKFKQKMTVIPVACAPAQHIIDNINSNSPKFNRWLRPCRPHGRTALLVSAGPSLPRYISRIKKRLKDGDADIFTVKHAMPTLLDNKIVPFACVVLDPRPLNEESTHLVNRRELYSRIPRKTLMFVSSMVTPETLEFMMERQCNIIGWHTLTNEFLKCDPGIQKLSHAINGGTCSAWRAFFIALTMGYRRFELYSYDFCYPSKSSKAQQEIMEVNVGSGTFFTTGELIAAYQDFQKFIIPEVQRLGLSLETYDDGLINEMMKNVKYDTIEIEDLKRLYGLRS